MQIIIHPTHDDLVTYALERCYFHADEQTEQVHITALGRDVAAAFDRSEWTADASSPLWPAVREAAEQYMAEHAA